LVQEPNIPTVQKILLNWIESNYDQYPWREEQDPIFALVAEIMLQKTRADNVLPVYNRIKEKYPTLKKIKQASEEQLLEELYPLGLRKRNLNLVHLLKNLDKVPETKKELIKLKGVGEYTANAFLSLHQGINQPITDTNALRLWTRVFDKPWTSKDYQSKDFIEFTRNITPNKDFKDFNYAVLDLARKICKPKPKCTMCPLNEECIFRKEQTCTSRK